MEGALTRGQSRNGMMAESSGLRRKYRGDRIIPPGGGLCQSGLRPGAALACGNRADAFEKFHTVCNREKSKLVLGQILSSDAESAGLGSGVAKGDQAVRDDIRQFDARCSAPPSAISS